MPDLERFVQAQAAIHERVLQELGAGRKTSHWMWFVFPQLRGLGRSEMAVRFGIESLEEARDFLLHPVLGARLVECTERVMQVDGRSAFEIFGSPDDLKFRSCMTLYALACEGDSVFRRALLKFFDARMDTATLALLKRGEGA